MHCERGLNSGGPLLPAHGKFRPRMQAGSHVLAWLTLRVSLSRSTSSLPDGNCSRDGGGVCQSGQNASAAVVQWRRAVQYDGAGSRVSPAAYCDCP